jgi:hypothetical protein
MINFVILFKIKCLNIISLIHVRQKISESFLDSSLSIGTKCDETLLLNLRIERVERLGEVVVEFTRVSVVLRSNRDQGPHILRCGIAFLLLSAHDGCKSRCVLKVFFSCLRVVLVLLNRELVDRLVSWLVSPVGSQALSLCSLIFFTLTSVPVLPSDSSTKEIPIEISV